jgi:hypothetical protein
MVDHCIKIMAELKTKENNASVKQFIDAIENSSRKKDCLITKKIMQDITGKRAKMWGDSIVGFGRYHYKYASGREGEFFITGFSPRKQNFTIYIMPGYEDYQHLLKKIGKHKTGKSCLYVKSLDDIDLDVLKELIAASVAEIRSLYQTDL